MEQNVKRSVQVGARLVTIPQFVWNVRMDILGKSASNVITVVINAKIILFARIVKY